jgi:septum formation protein
MGPGHIAVSAPRSGKETLPNSQGGWRDTREPLAVAGVQTGPCVARMPALPGSVLILASASPRRAELLTAAGIPFEVRPATVDERIHPGEEARGYALRVAMKKARAVMTSSGGRPVLAADTVVVVDGHILGKPADVEDAKRMLHLLSGRTHEVLTAVVVVPASRGDLSREETIDGQVEVTAVEFASLDTAEIDWYVETGEPSDKAGSYAIQGAGSRFVTRIQGSYSNVVGLPVGLVYAMCSRAGVLLS